MSPGVHIPFLEVFFLSWGPLVLSDSCQCLLTAFLPGNPSSGWCFLPAARSRPDRCLPILVPLIGFNSLCCLPGSLFGCYNGGTWNLGSRLLPVSFYWEVAPQDLVTLNCMILSKMKKACWWLGVGALVPASADHSPPPPPRDWKDCPCSSYCEKHFLSLRAKPFSENHHY